MPRTVTLKNIPDDVYERLKAAAAVHHRSLNSEVIFCLESALLPRKRLTAQERIEHIRALRAGLRHRDFDHDIIGGLKNAGRP